MYELNANGCGPRMKAVDQDRSISFVYCNASTYVQDETATWGQRSRRCTWKQRKFTLFPLFPALQWLVLLPHCESRVAGVSNVGVCVCSPCACVILQRGRGRLVCMRTQ